MPLAEVRAPASKGRITEADVQAFVKAVMAGGVQTAAQRPPRRCGRWWRRRLPGLLPWPKVDFEKFGPVERKEMGRIKKISAPTCTATGSPSPRHQPMTRRTSPSSEAFRVQLNKENEKSGIKVTMLAFMIKAAVAALKKFPSSTARWMATPWC